MWRKCEKEVGKYVPEAVRRKKKRYPASLCVDRSVMAAAARFPVLARVQFMRVSSSRGLLFSLALLSLGVAVPSFSWAEGVEEVREVPESLRPDVLYLLLLGEIAGSRGELGVATQAYLQASNETHDVRVIRRAAQMAIAARDLRATASVAQLWMQLDPQSEDARLLLESVQAGGDQRINQIQFEIARVLANNSQRLEANLLGLNAAFAGVRDKTQVRTLIERLTAPYANEPAAYVARAQAAESLGQVSEADKQIDRALQLRPQWEPAVMLKAEYLAKLGDVPGALALLQSTLKENPEQMGTRAVYAHLLAAAERLKEAEAEFRVLMQHVPDNVQVRMALADVLARDGRLPEARQQLDEVLRLHPEEENAIWFAQGGLAERQNRLEDARRAYAQVKPGEGYFDAQLRIAVVMGRQGKVALAREHLHKLEVQEDEQRRRALLVEVGILRAAHKYADALLLLDDSLTETPEDTELLYEAAMLEENLQRYEQMEAHVRRILALEPDNAHAYNLLGYSLANRNDRLDEAADLIERASALEPDSAHILDSLGWVRFRQGNLREAEHYLQLAFAREPDAEIAAHLGEVLWVLGRREEAKKLWYSSLEANPDSGVLRATMHRLLTP